MAKANREHLIRKAFLYIRQSTMRQVYENTESTKRQYALKAKLIDMGWDESRIEIIDSDLGQSGAKSDERHGFQYLVSEVSLGRAGIVAGIEVSRLSRSSADWNRLLQIAALSDTLIMDEDGIYNVNDFNDRLLLGLKGTLSEAELHYLKARMRGGALNKAKRGELRRSCLPIGYVYDENGQTTKDPDAGVQESVALLFATFKRVGSAHGVVSEFKKQGYLFPSRAANGNKPGELSQEVLTYTKVIRMLKNPAYAGIYVYGKTQTQHTVDGRKQKNMPKDQCHAWLPDSHPSYIDVATFDENNLKLSNNKWERQCDIAGGAVREGSALLQGIAICGFCGRKMRVGYSYSDCSSQPIYQCNYKKLHYCEPVCQRVVGGNIDHVIGGIVLETINPLTTDAAISIEREMTGRKDEIIRLYGQQMERARYEMDLAKRRYLRVDPDNRLVAAELERDWNKKAAEYESAKTDYEKKCEPEVRAIDEKLKLALSQLVTDFPKIWNSPETSSKERKRITRLVLEDVTITSKGDNVVLGIRFKGGATRVVEIPKKAKDPNELRMEQEAADEIARMIPLGMTNQEIADSLNAKGFKTITKKSFNRHNIQNFREKFNLPSRREIAQREGWLTTKEKMSELGITNRCNFYRLLKTGKLIFKECNLPGIKYLYAPESAVKC